MTSLPTVRYPANLYAQGWVKSGADGDEVPRRLITQDPLASYMIPWSHWTKHNEPHTRLPGTPAGSDLGLIGTTFGTNTPAISSGDLKAAGATTRYARAQIELPPEYDDGQTVILRIPAGMVTHQADGSATIDIEAFLSDGAGGKTGSDLCTTNPQDCNSTTFTDYEFTISSAGLVRGSVLDIRLALAVTDTATSDPVAAVLGKVAVCCDIRG